jgi:diguanylate cyclase (GGDEF)-like protein
VTLHVRGLAGQLRLLNATRVALALVGLVGLGLAVYGARVAASSTDRSDRVLAQANTLERKVIDLETGLRGYAITRDNLFLEPMAAARQQLPDDLAALRRLVRDNPAQTRRMQAIADAVWAYDMYWLQPALELDPARQALAAQMWAIVGRERMELIRERFEAFESAEGKLRSARAARVERYERTAAGIVIGVLLALGGASLVGARWLRRRVIDPLAALRGVAERLEAGDLAVRARTDGYAEVGEVGRALNAIADELAASRARSEELTEELERQGRTDPLTGIANRRAFDEHLARECANARRHGGDLSLLVVDVDGFKAINDAHGHAAGDAVLASIAAICATQRRAGDLVARTGGDEFAILLPRTPPRGAEAVVAELGRRIAAEQMIAGGARVAVAVAIGVATAAHRADPDALLKAADADMNGRRRFASQQAGLTALPAAAA